MSEDILPFFSYMIFMVSYLIFKSLKDFEFIFMYGVNECSIFIDSCAAVQLSQYYLLKRLSFLYCILLHHLSNIN